MDSIRILFVFLAFIFASIEARAMSKNDRQKLDKIMENLPTIPIANISEDVEKYMKSPQVCKSWYQVGVGVYIENYSRFKLESYTWHPYDKTVHIQRPIPDFIESGKAGLFIVDNSNVTRNRVRGSMSWLILHSNGDHLKKNGKPMRLVLTYSVPYSGDCDMPRENQFTLYMDFANPKEAEAEDKHIKDYTTFHNHNLAKSIVGKDDGGPIYVTFSPTFNIYGTINNACSATLNLKIFQNLNFYQGIKTTTPLAKNEEKPNAKPLKQSATDSGNGQENSNVDNNSQSILESSENDEPVMNLEVKYLVYLSGGVIFFIVVIFTTTCGYRTMQRRKRENALRRPYDAPEPKKPSLLDHFSL